MEGQPAANCGLERAGKFFHVLPLSALSQRRTSANKDSELKQPTVSCRLPFGPSSNRGIRRQRSRDSTGGSCHNSAGQPGSSGDYWLVSMQQCLSYERRNLQPRCLSKGTKTVSSASLCAVQSHSQASNLTLHVIRTMLCRRAIGGHHMRSSCGHSPSAGVSYQDACADVVYS